MTTTSNSPGRPRSFDVDDAVDTALDLFWDRGYRQTSTRDLEKALGISQSSLYNAFGSKRDLLLRAIDRYEARVRSDLLDHLEPEGGLAAIDAFLAALAEWVVDTNLRGCLVVSLMSSAHGDPVIDERAAAYRSSIRQALRTALAGTAPDEVVAARAESVLAASFGVHAISRTSNPAEVRAMVEGIRAEVASWA